MSSFHAQVIDLPIAVALRHGHSAENGILFICSAVALAEFSSSLIGSSWINWLVRISKRYKKIVHSYMCQDCHIYIYMLSGQTIYMFRSYFFKIMWWIGKGTAFIMYNNNNTDRDDHFITMQIYTKNYHMLIGFSSSVLANIMIYLVNPLHVIELLIIYCIVMWYILFVHI